MSVGRLFSLARSTAGLSEVLLAAGRSKEAPAVAAAATREQRSRGREQRSHGKRAEDEPPPHLANSGDCPTSQVSRIADVLGRRQPRLPRGGAVGSGGQRADQNFMRRMTKRGKFLITFMIGPQGRGA